MCPRCANDVIMPEGCVTKFESWSWSRADTPGREDFAMSDMGSFSDFDGDAFDREYYLEGMEDYYDIAADGEFCPMCGAYLLIGGFTGQVIECPLCGTRVKMQ